ATPARMFAHIDVARTPRRPPADGSRGRRAAAVAVAVLLALVAACWAVVALFGSFPGDREVAAEVAEEQLGPLGLLPAHILDRLGDPVPATVTVVLGVLAAWHALGLRAAVLFAASSGAVAVTLAL